MLVTEAICTYLILLVKPGSFVIRTRQTHEEAEFADNSPWLVHRHRNLVFSAAIDGLGHIGLR